MLTRCDLRPAADRRQMPQLEASTRPRASPALSRPTASCSFNSRNIDAVKAWRQEGEADLENDVGEKYAKFRVYAVEGVAQ